MLEHTDKWDAKQLARGASFLQSRPWVDFQHSLGLTTYLLSGTGWSCLLIKKANRFGKYLFAPYGPTLDSPGSLDGCIEALVAQARLADADWLKLEPVILKGNLSTLKDYLSAAGATHAAHNVEPALTRIIDLTPPADDLLAGTSQSTRSLIRKNQREKTLVFKTSNNPADMAGFSALLDTVAKRKGVGFFDEPYFTKQAEVLMPAKMMFLEQAFHKNKLVGAAVMHDYGPRGSYTYAASLPEARALSVSALLLWQALINAKSRGVKLMDLYGIAAEDASPSHPWYGFSTYKRKFGGQIEELAGTWDIPISKRYRLYRAAQKVKRVLRRR